MKEEIKEERPIQKFWCVACHRSKVTLYKIGSTARICNYCKSKIHKYGEINIVDGSGRLFVKDEVLHFEAKEDKQWTYSHVTQSKSEQR